MSSKQYITLENLGVYRQEDKAELNTALTLKQDALVSGTSIKTINGGSLLGSGDISVVQDVPAATDLEIDRLFRDEYPIAVSVTNGSYSGDTSIWTEETAEVTLTPAATYSLPETISVSGATYVYNDSTGVISLSAVTGNVVISATCTPAMPVKGDIVTLDGGSDRYRVIKVNGTVIEVLALDDVASNIQYNSTSETTTFYNKSGGTVTGQKYEGSLLDTYMNSTFYATLSSNIKNAIVPKNITQSYVAIWYSYSSSGEFFISKVTSGENSYQISGSVSVGDRYCYALDVNDVVEYLGVPLDVLVGQHFSGANLNNMFFEQTTAVEKAVGLASAVGSSNVCSVYGSSGSVGSGGYSNRAIARPAFQVDLANLSFAKE